MTTKGINMNRYTQARAELEKLIKLSDKEFIEFTQSHTSRQKCDHCSDVAVQYACNGPNALGGKMCQRHNELHYQSAFHCPAAPTLTEPTGPNHRMWLATAKEVMARQRWLWCFKPSTRDYIAAQHEKK
jgi:hypothetical protein